MPKPYNDFPRLLGVVRPETEHDKPMPIVLVDKTVDYNVFQVAVIQGHNIPFYHPERWEVDSSSCPKSLVHFTKECNLVGTIAGGLIPGGPTPASREDGYFSAYRPRRESDGRPDEGPPSIRELGVRDDAEIIIVYDGRCLVQFSHVCETLSGDFVTQRAAHWEVFGQVAARISGGKLIAR